MRDSSIIQSNRSEAKVVRITCGAFTGRVGIGVFVDNYWYVMFEQRQVYRGKQDQALVLCDLERLLHLVSLLNA